MNTFTVPVLMLLAAICSVHLPPSVAFKMPTKQAPDSLIHDLIKRAQALTDSSKSSKYSSRFSFSKNHRSRRTARSKNRGPNIGLKPMHRQRDTMPSPEYTAEPSIEPSMAASNEIPGPTAEASVLPSNDTPDPSVQPSIFRTSDTGRSSTNPSEYPHPSDGKKDYYDDHGYHHDDHYDDHEYHYDDKYPDPHNKNHYPEHSYNYDVIKDDWLQSQPEDLDEKGLLGDDFGYDYYDDHSPWWHCSSAQNPHRTVTVAADYAGPLDEFMYVDRNHGMAKFGLGATDEEIEVSKAGALLYFQQHFGLDIDMSTFGMHTDGYMYSNATGMAFAPVVFNVTFRVVADSWYSQSCADVRALMGGWVLSAENVTVKGTLGGEKGIFYEGQSLFASLFVVGAPGTPDSTRIAFFPIYPINCGRDGSCVLSGMSWNFENEELGWIDGSSVSYHFPGYEYQQVMRLVAMWPGRFHPLPGAEFFME